MANTLQVSITADVADLTAKLALAQENLRQTTAEMGRLSKSMLDAGTGASASLTGSFTEAATASAGARAEVSKLKAMMAAATGDMGHFSGSTSVATRELLVLGREAARGNFSRMAGSMTILATQGFGLSTAMLAAAGGVAAVAGGLIYFALQAHKAAEAGKELEGVVAFRGLDVSRAQIDDLIQRLHSLSGVSIADAQAIGGSFLRMRDTSVPVMRAMIDVLPAVAAEMGEKMPEAAKQFAAALGDPARAGDAFLEKLGASRQAVQAFDAALARGDIAGARAEMLQALSDGAERYEQKTHAATDSTRGFYEVIQSIAGGEGDTEAVAMLQKQIDAIDPERVKKAAADLKEAFASLQAAPPSGAPLEQVRAQIAQMSALHEGARSELLAQEIKTWQDRIAVGDLYGKDLTEAETARDRARLELARESGSEAIAATRQHISEMQAAGDKGRSDMLAAEAAAYRQLLAGDKLTAEQRLEVRRQLNVTLAELGRAETEDMVKETDRKIADADRELKAGIDHDDQLFKQHKLSIAERVAAEEGLVRQTEQLELALLDAEIAQLHAGTDAWRDAMDKRRQLVAKFESDVKALHDKGATDQQKEDDKSAKEFLRTLQPMESGFNTMIRGMMGGRMTMQQAFLSGLQQMATREIETDAALLLKKLALYAAELAGFNAAAAEKQLTEQAANESSLAGLAIKALKAIGTYAAEAFAGAYQAVVGIPYVGPAIAPGVAAGAEAAVMGAASVVSAAGGMFSVPSDNFLIKAHMGESVLPENIASPMRDFFGDGGGSQGGDMHLHGPLVSISGGVGLTTDQIAMAVQKGIRSFNPVYRGR